MPSRHPVRYVVLLLGLLVAACGGGEERRDFPPLRYDYLPPIQLDVSTITIEQRFVPGPNDVGLQAPIPPVNALRTMAQDRLTAFGGNARAVVAIQDASLNRRGDVITGSMVVSLTIFREDGSQAGFVEARVTRTLSGASGSLRGKLYDLVQAMMEDKSGMNVELEYQIRRHLKEFLASPAAPATAVEQAPLAAPSRR